MSDNHKYPYQQPGFRHPNGRKYTPEEKQALSNEFAVGGAVFFSMLMPILAGLAMMPFWDHVGEWRLVAYINDILAPAIGKLPIVHQGALTQRRFLIGASAILYVLFLVQFIFVLASKQRRFLYLESYDLTKKKGRFYATLVVLWTIVALIWYLVFVDETWIWRNAGGGRLAGRLTVWFPVLVLILGQMSTFALLGIIRDITHLPRKVRRLSYKIRGRSY